MGCVALETQCSPCFQMNFRSRLPLPFPAGLAGRSTDVRLPRRMCRCNGDDMQATYKSRGICLIRRSLGRMCKKKYVRKMC
jgi:hypothetical protein